MTIILDCLLMILPGITSILIFHQDVFYKLDWVKIILLSASITVPFALFNFVVATLLLDEWKENNDEGLFLHFSIGLVLTSIFLYIFLALSYLFGFSFKLHLSLVLIFEFGFLMIAFFIRNNKENKK